MKFYKILRVIVSAIFKPLFRIHSHGLENFPKSGGCIVAPNHTSALDPILLAVSEERPIIFMAKAELFKIPLLSQLMRALGAFPVNRKESDITAIKKSISIVERGDPLCVFPQGTRCAGVDLSETSDKIKSGVGLIAFRTNAPIVPVYIKTKKNKIRMFGRTDIYYGTPILPEEYLAFESKTKYQDTADLAFERILMLKNESEVAS